MMDDDGYGGMVLYRMMWCVSHVHLHLRIHIENGQVHSCVNMRGGKSLFQYEPSF